MYRSNNIVRLIKSKRLIWVGHVARMEEDRSSFKILTGKPTGKRPIVNTGRKYKENIGIDIKEIGTITRNLVDSAQN